MPSSLLSVFSVGTPALYTPHGQGQSYRGIIAVITIDLELGVSYRVNLPNGEVVGNAEPDELQPDEGTVFSRIMTP